MGCCVAATTLWLWRPPPLPATTLCSTPPAGQRRCTPMTKRCTGGQGRGAPAGQSPQRMPWTRCTYNPPSTEGGVVGVWKGRGRRMVQCRCCTGALLSLPTSSVDDGGGASGGRAGASSAAAICTEREFLQPSLPRIVFGALVAIGAPLFWVRHKKIAR